MAAGMQPIVVAPRLLRAVAECTQAYGPVLEGPAYYSLQVRHTIMTHHFSTWLPL